MRNVEGFDCFSNPPTTTQSTWTCAAAWLTSEYKLGFGIS